jgi:Aspartyl protease
MPQQLIFPIATEGLLVDIHIGLPAEALEAQLALGKPFVPVTQVRGLIDTGADATSVDPEVLAGLGLISAGQAQMTTASGKVRVDRYVISLGIFGPAGVGGPGLVRPVWNVTNLSHSLADVKVLIGMDLIRQIILKIDGPARKFTIDF